MYPVGRSAWSLQPSKMAVGLASKAADEEARAEVEVLNSRLEKTSQLSKKIQASLSRLELNGKSMQDAIGPIYGNTQKLQVLGSSMERPEDRRIYTYVLMRCRYRRNHRGHRTHSPTLGHQEQRGGCHSQGVRTAPALDQVNR
jgi:hypothetical protein